MKEEKCYVERTKDQNQGSKNSKEMGHLGVLVTPPYKGRSGEGEKGGKNDGPGHKVGSLSRGWGDIKEMFGWERC